MSIISENTVWLKDIQNHTKKVQFYYLDILKKSKADEGVTQEELENFKKWNIEHFEVFEAMAVLFNIDTNAQLNIDEITENFIRGIYPFEVEIFCMMIFDNKAAQVCMLRLKQTSRNEKAQLSVYLNHLIEITK